MVISVTASTDGSRLAAVSISGEPRVWDLSTTGPATLANLATEGFISSIDLARDRSTALVTERFGERARIRAFDLATGDTLASSEDLAVDSVGAGILSPVGSAETSIVAGVNAGGNASIFDLSTGVPLMELPPCLLGDRHMVPIGIDDLARWVLVAIEPSCGGPDRVKAIDVATGQTLSSWSEPIELNDVGPSGTPSEGLVAGQFQGAGGVEIRNVLTDTVLGSFDARDMQAWKPYFSDDGRYLTFSTALAGAWVIDVEQVKSGTAMEDAVVLNKHVEGGPTTFSITGGGYLVTGHSGEVLRLWELDSGEEWLSLPVDTGGPTIVAMTADAAHLYYADRGGLVRRFPLDPRELANLARDRVQRDFTPEECQRFLIAEDCSIYAGT